MADAIGVGNNTDANHNHFGFSSSVMFRVKICGVRTIDDALAACDAGADAIGLNFYAKSPRSVQLEEAKAIRRQVKEQSDSVSVIGVFVNTPVEQVRQIAEEVGLTGVQLHGDEPPAAVHQLAGLPVVRARRMGAGGVAPIAKDLDACRDAGRGPDAVLIDAASSGAYGGTGKTLDWETLATDRATLHPTPLILAGGLHADNIEEAIARVRPHGVDTASGVESAPGVKDSQRMRDFVSSARAALAAGR